MALAIPLFVFAETSVNTTKPRPDLFCREIRAVLQRGSRGADVIALQTELETRGYLKMPAGTAKGYFGVATENAIKQYQRKYGIEMAGVFGPKTRAIFNKCEKGDDRGNDNANNTNNTTINTGPQDICPLNPGDFNKDGIVDYKDKTIIDASYAAGKPVGCLLGDMKVNGVYNGVVDFDDYVLFDKAFNEGKGSTCPPVAAKIIGDLNYDGDINAADYSMIKNGYDNHLSGYTNGDINCDGVIDYDDYVLLDQAHNKMHPPIPGQACGTKPSNWLLGDLDVDGHITIDKDYQLMNSVYAAHSANPGWCKGDLNDDGEVDFDDYVLMDQSYNSALNHSGVKKQNTTN